MTDAEYLFKTTSSERKRNGVGDYHKKRGGGRPVRMPSDYLSKKEKAMLNSDVTKINLNAPVSWAEFITWPKDLQIEYIQRLEEAYHAKNEDIAGMLDVSISCYRKHKNSLGIKGKAGHGKPIDRAGWAKFIGANEFAPEILVESSPVVTEKEELPEQKEQKTYTIRDACAEHMKEEAKQFDIQNIAAMLRVLVGTGAKLTIEVTL